MAEPFSLEIQELLDAADRAIARSRDLADQRRQMRAEYEMNRREQEVRLAFRRRAPRSPSHLRTFDRLVGQGRWY
jgi:hypothetical protein